MAMFEETSTLSTVHILIKNNRSESSHVNVRNTSLGHSEAVTTFANKTQHAITQTPLHSYLLSQSTVHETLRSSEGTNTVIAEVNKESNNPREILASQLVTAGPKLGNSLTDTAGTMPTLTPAIVGNTCTNPSEVSVFGLQAWKFGLLSAVVPVFLAVEALALAIYCTKCKKRGRKAIPAKSYEDSEAAETINAESNENTVTVNNTRLSQAKNPTETSETQSFSEVEKEATDQQSQEPSDSDMNYEGKPFTA
ncbi:uncharacterized protein [Heterodontus francisci]